jgi:hypothetical protein
MKQTGFYQDVKIDSFDKYYWLIKYGEVRATKLIVLFFPKPDLLPC